MSSSRIIYDDDCKKVRLAQNVMPGNYQLFEFTGINPKKCKPNRLPRNSVN